MWPGETDCGVNTAGCTDKLSHQHTFQVATLVLIYKRLAPRLVSGILGGQEQIVVQDCVLDFHRPSFLLLGSSMCSVT